MTFVTNIGNGLSALWNRLNPQQKMGLWLALIASGGPLAKLLVTVIGVPSEAVQEIVQWLNYITPIIAGGAYIGTQTDSAKVAGIESLPTERKAEVAAALPVAVKAADAASMSPGDATQMAAALPDNAVVSAAGAMEGVSVMVASSAPEGAKEAAADPSVPGVTKA